MRLRRAAPLVGLALLAVVVLSGGAVAEPATTSNETVDIQQSSPAEQVPYGVRTIYGNEDLERPSGGDNVSVAVIDTGVDRDHPDLRDRIALCRDFTGQAVRNRCRDDEGHGTHVAGTVAADGGPDGTGIYGVAPEAEIYAFKACDDEGRCETSALSRAIRAAADEEADVAVLSLGGENESRLADSIRYATSRGVIVVAAAGNDGPELGSILYPAADGRVIAVGAVGPRDERTVEPNNYRVPDFSSRGVEGSFREGERYLELSAPGVRVLSPVPGGGYERKSGTSMATPHVGGLTAKVLSGPDPPDRSDVRAALRTRAERFDVTEGRHATEGYDPAAGFGVPTVEGPTAAIRTEPSAPTENDTFVLDGGATTKGDSEIVSYEWDTSGDGHFDRTGERVERSQPGGNHTVTLRVTDADGATSTANHSYRVTRRPVVRFTVEPTVPAVNETVRLDASDSFDPDGTDLSYEWDFSGDGETDATGERIETEFDDPGARVVQLTVADEHGATNATTRELIVNDVPRLSVDRPGRIFAGELVTLRAIVENEVGETTVRWELPAETVAGTAITRSFPEGETTITVAIEDEYGATATETIVVRTEPTMSWQDTAIPAGALAVLTATAGYLLWRRQTASSRRR